MVTTQDYYSRTEGVYEIFSEDKEKCSFSSYSAESKCYDNSNKLVVGKMKYETSGIANK